MHVYQGAYQLLLMSASFSCNFSFSKQNGPAFKIANDNKSKAFCSNDPIPTLQGTTATVNVNITQINS